MREMDAGPDRWNGTLEAFLDKFEVRLVQLNESKDKPVEDRDAEKWLVSCLRKHPGAMAAVNQMRQLDMHERTKNASYVRTYPPFINGLRVSFQQWDNDNKAIPKPNKSAKQVDIRANATNQQTTPSGTKPPC